MVEFVQFTTDRLVMIYGVYSMICLMFLVFAYKLSKRGESTPQKTHIVRFFVFTALGLILNMAYAPFDNVPIQMLGNKTVILLTTMSLCNLMLFTLIVNKSSMVITDQKRFLIQAVVLGLCVVYYVIPITFGEGFQPDWRPIMWIYMITVTETLILSMYFGIRTAINIEAKEIRRRFLNFLIGVLFIAVMLVYTALRNGRIITSPIFLLLGLAIIPGGLLIYYGVGRELDEKQK